MAKRNYDQMSKTELRAACKAAGISYGKLTVQGMRDGLTKGSIWDERNGPDDSKPKGAKTAEPVVNAAAKPERIVQNGVRRPLPDSACGVVWSALDKMHAGGMVPTSQQIRELAIASNWNENNSLTELSQWRRFHGLARQVKNMKPKRKTVAKAALPAARMDGEVDQQTA